MESKQEEQESGVLNFNDSFLQLTESLVPWNDGDRFTTSTVKAWKRHARSLMSQSLMQSTSSSQLSSRELSSNQLDSTRSVSGMTSSEIKIFKKVRDDIFTEDFLNVILKPKFVTVDADGNTLRQSVHTKDLSRKELAQLRQRFDGELSTRHARLSGLDNIRSALSFELFDEIIRQASVDCKERALLLLRIRDESKLTLEAYRYLYLTSSRFSIRKGESSKQNGLEQVQQKHADLVNRKRLLTEKLRRLKKEHEDVTERQVTTSAQLKKQCDVQIKSLKQFQHTLEKMIQETKPTYRRTSRARRRSSVKMTSIARLAAHHG